MHTLTNELATGLSVLDVAPGAEEIVSKVSTVSIGRRRPILVLAIDGAFVPMRPESARGRRPGRKRKWAKRAQWRDAKGFRLYLLDGERITHVLSWQQVQDEQALGDALKQVKEAGLIPEDQVRLYVVAHGARWIWKHVKALFPLAVQILDYYYCVKHVYNVGKEQYGDSLQALEWAEVTMIRLLWGQVQHVISGLKRMHVTSESVANAIDKLVVYLDERRTGYPSGAWWYEANSN